MASHTLKQRLLAAVLLVLVVLVAGANADAGPGVKFADLRKGGAVAAPTNALYHYNRLIAALDAVPTAAVDPLAAASNLTGKVIGDVTVTSGLVAAFAIVTGLLLVVFGHYLFKPVLFIAGFYFFAVVTYSILQNISYKTDHAFSETLYLAVCIIVGLLGGGLAVWLWKAGFFVLGAFLGYIAAIAILAALSGVVVSALVRWIVIIVLALVGGILVLSFELPVLIVATSVVGAYAVFFGIDIFAQTDFAQVTLAIVTSGSFSPPAAGAKWPYMLGGFALLAIIGIAHQFHQVRRNGGKHRGIQQRNEGFRSIPKNHNYSTVPY